MITYHGTNKLVLVKRAISVTRYGLFSCNAQYSCRNDAISYWANRLIRGNTLPGMEGFIIDMDVNIDIGQNGFTTFYVSGYARDLGKIDKRTLF